MFRIIRAPTHESGARLNPLTRSLIQAALVILPTLAAYAAVRHHTFVWDTIPFVLDNPWVHEWTAANVIAMFTEVHRANWHPVVLLSHALDISLFGYDSGSHHVVNVVLHCANALLVMILAQTALTIAGARATVASWTGCLTGLMFAIHPQHVESVAWVVARKDVLYSLFTLLSLITYLKLQGRAARHWAPFVLFLFAVGAKPMAVSLPFVLMLLDVYPLNRPVSTVPDIRRLVAEKSHYLIVALIVMGVTLSTQSMAMPGTERLPLWATAINAAHNTWFYVGHYLWPVGLSPFYPYPSLEALLSPGFVLSGTLFLAATLVMTGWLFSRGIRWPLVLVAFYLVTLLPASGLVHVSPAKAADRFVYLATLPLSFITALLIVRGCASKPLRAPLVAIAIGYAGFLVAITHTQVTVWRDPLTLWTRVVMLYPDDPFGHRNLASAYYEIREFELALDHAERSLELGSPDRDYVQRLRADLRSRGVIP